MCVEVDLAFLDQLISDGADPNSSDRFGQTVLHEVSFRFTSCSHWFLLVHLTTLCVCVCVQISRAWSVDVMRFFLDRGSDLLRPDHFGVTALHVASALDYQHMVQFLLERKGQSQCTTTEAHGYCSLLNMSIGFWPQALHRSGLQILIVFMCCCPQLIWRLGLSWTSRPLFTSLPRMTLCLQSDSCCRPEPLSAAPTTNTGRRCSSPPTWVLLTSPLTSLTSSLTSPLTSLTLPLT